MIARMAGGGRRRSSLSAAQGLWKRVIAKVKVWTLFKVLTFLTLSAHVTGCLYWMVFTHLSGKPYDDSWINGNSADTNISALLRQLHAGPSVLPHRLRHGPLPRGRPQERS